MMLDVKNLKQAIMPITWLNCIFCMGIFEINRPRYFLSIFYVISIMTGYFIILHKGILIFEKSFIYELKIFYFSLGINVLVAVWAIILFWWKSEITNNIIKRNSIVDNTLEALGMKTDYQKLFRNILSLMAIWIVSIITLSITHIVWLYSDTGYWFTLHSCICISFPIMINSVVDLTFASFVRCVQSKFQKTNTLINNAVLGANKSNVFKIHNRHENISIVFVTTNYKNRKDNILHLMQTLRHLHLEITRIGRQINSAYCLQLLLELAVHFTIITLSFHGLYNVYIGVFSGQLYVTVSNKKVINLIIWACIYSLKIILINWLCSSTSTEAYKTGEIIQSFEGFIVDNDMKEEIHQFTQQIMLNSLNFTAYGFFSIDNSLTCKFFATVMTYVVILIQMNTT